jgi:hypothetical protein
MDNPKDKVIADSPVPGDIKPETVNFLKTLKDSVGTISMFFSFGYGMLLILSFSYNIGYFKYINPQIVEMMKLGDYVEDTLDNLWFLLIFLCIFFSTSLGAAKQHKDEQFPWVTTFGVAAICTSIYAFTRGEIDNKFWQTIKYIAASEQKFDLIIALIVIGVIVAAIAGYKFSTAYVRNKLPKYTPSIAAILSFTLIVTIPYCVGLIKGRYEREVVTSRDYRAQEVDIIYTNEQLLKDVYIIKSLDRGLVIREFLQPDSSESRFILINWGEVKRILYKDARKLPKRKNNL